MIFDLVVFDRKMGKKSFGMKGAHVARSSSVNNLPTESPSHISISEDEKSSPNVSNSGNLYPGFSPTRGVYRSSPCLFGIGKHFFICSA